MVLIYFRKCCANMKEIGLLGEEIMICDFSRFNQIPEIEQ